MKKLPLIFAFIWITSWAALCAGPSQVISGLLHPRLSPDGSQVVASYHGNMGAHDALQSFPIG